MSIRAMNWALETPAGGPANKVLLLALANYAQGENDDETFVGIARLSAQTDMSESSVKRHLAELMSEDLGLVRKVHHPGEGGGRETNSYVLAVPPRARGQIDPLPGQEVNLGGAIAQNGGGNSSLLTHITSTNKREPSRDDLAPRRKPETDLPEGWRPSAEHRKYAEEHGLSLAFVAAQFADHHAAKGSRFRDWDRAFWTWLRNQVNFSQRSGRVQPRRVGWEAN